MAGGLGLGPRLGQVWIFGPAGNRRFLRSGRALAAPETIPEGAGLSPPPFGMVFGAAGPAQNPKSAISDRSGAGVEMGTRRSGLHGFGPKTCSPHGFGPKFGIPGPRSGPRTTDFGPEAM